MTAAAPNKLQARFCQELAKQLSEPRVLLVFDPGQQLRPFLDDIATTPSSDSELGSLSLGEQPARLPAAELASLRGPICAAASPGPCSTISAIASAWCASPARSTRTAAGRSATPASMLPLLVGTPCGSSWRPPPLSRPWSLPSPGPPWSSCWSSSQQPRPRLCGSPSSRGCPYEPPRRSCRSTKRQNQLGHGSSGRGAPPLARPAGTCRLRCAGHPGGADVGLLANCTTPGDACITRILVDPLRI